MKYYIIPTAECAEVVEENTKEDALISFATKMDPDMSVYFKAVTEEEYLSYRRKKIHEGHILFETNWMSKKLQEDFGMTETDANNLSTVCYDEYAKGDGPSKYDCIEKIYKETKEEELSALKSMSEQYKAGKNFNGEIELCYGPDTIEVRSYNESSGANTVMATVSRGCLKADEVERLCENNHWYYSEC